MNQEVFTIHKIDARKINLLIKKQIVDVTITSPPYFNLKDYGYKEQIGYGQTYEEYLEDLKQVFKSVYNCTKDSGTLWVIIDAYRKEGEVIPLPFDFSNKIKDVGWKLKEIIIWGKDKTVPWAHKGQMRNSFEYILVFSKSNDYKFYIDEVRDYQSLKKWWVKYPERYNPRGKTPEAIWNFDIPTQGSWGKGYVNHFCPLPEEMIAQILKLTTKEGDTVLDPFSGSGTVLAKADNMKRKYIGSELNSNYIQMFKTYLKQTGEKKRKEYEAEEKNLLKQNEFEKLIIELRALKFARLAFQKLNETEKLKISRILVEISSSKPVKYNSLVVVDYYFLLIDNNQQDHLEDSLKEVTFKPPLSKFGIEPKFHFTSNTNDFRNFFNERNVFLYTTKVTHKYKKFFELEDLSKLPQADLIVSPIKVDLNENDYE